MFYKVDTKTLIMFNFEKCLSNSVGNGLQPGEKEKEEWRRGGKYLRVNT